MTTVNGHQVVRLEFTSAFEMLDFVQVVSDHMGRGVGLDDDAVHWVGVAIRESVINAIKHGNRNDATKRVFVEFETTTPPPPPGLQSRGRQSARRRVRAASWSRTRRRHAWTARPADSRARSG